MTEKDTTYSSLWTFRKGEMLPGLKDPIASMPSFKSVGIRKGIKYYSEFNPTIAENIINFWSNPGDTILDPFAGRTRGLVSGIKGRKYIGFEVAKEVSDKINELIDNNEEKFKEVPEIYNDDCFNLSNYNISADLIFTCPPYWNLEKYPSCPGQLSDIDDYETFLINFRRRMDEAVLKLKVGGYCILVVGDFRKNGKYYTFHNDVIKAMDYCGLKLHDLIIIQSVTFDIANKRFGGFKNSKITAKVHEYCLVFKK